MAIAFLLLGDPIWMIAAANFTYLIGIGLPSVAVWLLRRNEPDMRAALPRAARDDRARRRSPPASGALSTVLGFQQFGLPTVLFGARPRLLRVGRSTPGATWSRPPPRGHGAASRGRCTSS